jgi:hypothetical protein
MNHSSCLFDSSEEASSVPKVLLVVSIGRNHHSPKCTTASRVFGCNYRLAQQKCAEQHTGVPNRSFRSPPVSYAAG